MQLPQVTRQNGTVLQYTISQDRSQKSTSLAASVQPIRIFPLFSHQMAENGWTQPNTNRNETEQSEKSTVRLLVSGPGAGSAELLCLAPPGVGHEKSAVELDQDVADLLLALLIHVWNTRNHEFINEVTRDFTKDYQYQGLGIEKWTWMIEEWVFKPSKDS